MQGQSSRQANPPNSELVSRPMMVFANIKTHLLLPICRDLGAPVKNGGYATMWTLRSFRYIYGARVARNKMMIMNTTKALFDHAELVDDYDLLPRFIDKLEHRESRSYRSDAPTRKSFFT